MRLHTIAVFMASTALTTGARADLPHTMATGALRVAAGAPSWSGVGTGYALGHAVGLLVAFAHRPMAVTERCNTIACSLTHPVVGLEGERVTLTAAF